MSLNCDEADDFLRREHAQNEQFQCEQDALFPCGQCTSEDDDTESLNDSSDHEQAQEKRRRPKESEDLEQDQEPEELDDIEVQALLHYDLLEQCFAASPKLRKSKECIGLVATMDAIEARSAYRLAAAAENRARMDKEAAERRVVAIAELEEEQRAHKRRHVMSS